MLRNGRLCRRHRAKLGKNLGQFFLGNTGLHKFSELLA